MIGSIDFYEEVYSPACRDLTSTIRVQYAMKNKFAMRPLFRLCGKMHQLIVQYESLDTAPANHDRSDGEQEDAQDHMTVGVSQITIVPVVSVKLTVACEYISVHISLLPQYDSDIYRALSSSTSSGGPDSNGNYSDWSDDDDNRSGFSSADERGDEEEDYVNGEHGSVVDIIVSDDDQVGDDEGGSTDPDGNDSVGDDEGEYAESSSDESEHDESGDESEPSSSDSS